MSGLTPYTLVEPCAGSAALTLHLLGAKRAVLPYQGSKWLHRHALHRHTMRLGFFGPPSRVVLTDPGPWGVALGVILDPQRRPLLVEALREMEEVDDPTFVYESIHCQLVATDEVAFTAEFLFLQRLAFSGKAVGVQGGCWVSPGFNKTSAYGTPATDRFGQINPMLPSMIRVLESYEHALTPAVVEVRQTVATPPTSKVEGNTLVYLDPPYTDSTSYPNGQMSRDEVVNLALAWHDAGATVLVSEQRGLANWERHQISGGKVNTSPFKGKQEEWVSILRSIE